MLEGITSRRPNAERGFTFTHDLVRLIFSIQHLNVSGLCIQDVTLKLTNDRQVVMVSKGSRQSCEHRRILCARDIHDALVAHVTVRRDSIKGSLYVKRDSSVCLAVVNQLLRVRDLFRTPVDAHSINMPMPLDIDYATPRRAVFELLCFLLRCPATFSLSYDRTGSYNNHDPLEQFLRIHFTEYSGIAVVQAAPINFDEHCASNIISFGFGKVIAKAHKAAGAARSP